MLFRRLRVLVVSQGPNGRPSLRFFPPQNRPPLGIRGGTGAAALGRRRARGRHIADGVQGRQFARPAAPGVVPMTFWNSLPAPVIGLSPMDGVTDSAFR